MKLASNTSKYVEIVLSERNIRALLAKLSGFPLDSACMICIEDSEGVTLCVKAESNDTHYGTRPWPPGTMHPETESFLEAEKTPHE